MILSIQSNISNLHPRANVYGLPGFLSNSIQPVTNTFINEMMENIYPNPSNGNTTIEFNLPQGVNTGQLVIYNMQGVELKRYTVDNTFHTLLLNNSEFHAGTYFYQLQTASGASGAKKMIVIKN
jgi:type IX secretion system substrate protein